MKKFSIVLSLLIFISAFSSLASGQEGRKTILFNGKNLKNWAFQLRDATVDPAGIFTVNNGVIRIKGEPFGYMRTKKAIPITTFTLNGGGQLNRQTAGFLFMPSFLTPSGPDVLNAS